MGNAKNESIKNIWFGENIRSYQKMFLKMERKNHPVCKNCGQMTHGMPDNLDNYCEFLLKNLNKNY